MGAVPPDVKFKLVGVAPCSWGEGLSGKEAGVLSMVSHILCHLIIKSWLYTTHVGASELICGSLGE